MGKVFRRKRIRIEAIFWEIVIKIDALKSWRREKLSDKSNNFTLAVHTLIDFDKRLHFDKRLQIFKAIMQLGRLK